MKEKSWNTVHLVGAGAVGSHLAWILARENLWKVVEVWDPDRVCLHNLHNQCYIMSDVGQNKATSLCNHLKTQSTVLFIPHPEPFSALNIAGHLVLAVDSMEARQSAACRVAGQRVFHIVDVRVGRTPDGIPAGVLLLSRPWSEKEMAFYRGSLFSDGASLDRICDQRIEASFSAWSAAVAAQVLKRIHEGTPLPSRIVWQANPLSLHEAGTVSSN